MYIAVTQETTKKDIKARGGKDKKGKKKNKKTKENSKVKEKQKHTSPSTQRLSTIPPKDYACQCYPTAAAVGVGGVGTGAIDAEAAAYSPGEETRVPA